MIRKMRRQLAMASVALLMMLGMATVAAPSASAASGTITGNVQCFYGNNHVDGIWVAVNSGTSGFASMTPDGYGGVNYSYTLSQSSNYTLHVGCGNTSQNWGATMYTPNVSGNYYNWVCSYSTSYGYFCAMS